MPNYCSNTATIKHTDTAMITRVADAFANNHLFAEFVPITTDSTTDSHTASWGTKWDVGERDGGVMDQETTDTSISLYFETAWCPPIEFYDAMINLGFEIDATYHEPGMCFCGYYKDGADEYWDYDETLDLPEHIIDDFGLAEQYADYED